MHLSGYRFTICIVTSAADPKICSLPRPTSPFKKDPSPLKKIVAGYWLHACFSHGAVVMYLNYVHI